MSKRVIKDSILIAKNARSSVEDNEKQRSRCIFAALLQVIIFCLYVGLQVMFIVNGTFDEELVVLALITVCDNKQIDYFDRYFKSLLSKYHRTHEIKTPQDFQQNVIIPYKIRELLMCVLLIVFTVLQFFYLNDDMQWKLTILPCAIILGVYLLVTLFTIYQTLKYVNDYMLYQQNHQGMRKALISQANFEDNLRKSVQNPQSPNQGVNFSIANESVLLEKSSDNQNV